MEEKSRSVSIIGTGLIGASLGKALSKKFFVKGLDKKVENAEIALKKGAISKICSLNEALKSRVIIISIPVQYIPAFIKENASLFDDGSIVMDTGSVKRKVVEAMEALPPDVEFVGGHPIAGKEKSGPEFLDGTLFNGKKFVLTEENRLTKEGKSIITDIMDTISAIPVFMKAALHDKILAYTSHFPYVAAVSIFKTVMQQNTDSIFEFAGSGLKDTTRIASGDILMSMGMVLENKDNVIKALEQYMEILNTVKEKIEKSDIETVLKYVKDRRDKLWK